MIRIANTTEPRSDASMLADARMAMSHGLILAAGCLSRIALELRLIVACHVHDCEPKRKKFPTIEDRAQSLRKRGAMGKPMFRRVMRAATIGHRCAHGQVVDGLDVLALLDVADELVRFYAVGVAEDGCGE